MAVVDPCWIAFLSVSLASSISRKRTVQPGTSGVSPWQLTGRVPGARTHVLAPTAWALLLASLRGRTHLYWRPERFTLHRLPEHRRQEPDPVVTPAASIEPHPEPAPEPTGLRFRVAFFLVAGIVVALVITLPFAIRSLINDLSSSVEGNVYTLVGDSAAGSERERNQVHLGVIDLDESRLRVTLRVSAHRVCPTGCPTGNRVVLFSVGSDESATAGMPPSGRIDLTPSQSVVSESIDLPLRGHPTLYPFDEYELWLGVGLADLAANQADRPLTRQESQGLLTVTVQEVLPRENMEPPVSVAPSIIEEATDPYELQGVAVMRFSRPVHERVIAVLLVVLVAAAAAYAVFMRPLHDLVINSGGLVLGVWGIRSLLSPGTASRTLVDLSLSLVIMFLLSAITFRALEFLYARSGFRRRPPD
jgi:hypothetical protein